MSPDGPVSPRTFYLNEQHELARAEKVGGGGVPKYVNINWATKGTAITQSLSRVKTQIQASADPSKKNHYFLLAAPVSELTKASENKRIAIDGKIVEHTDFAEKHSRVFRRLGIDLLSVAEDGSAVVHMNPEMIEQLSNTARTLRDLGDREKSRWATIERFETIPPQLRIDSEWLGELRPKTITDAVVEFQPLLARSEIDSLIRAVVSTLAQGLGEAVTGTGADFSGRQWVRGKITRESLKRISETFFSVQSLHSPLISVAAGSSAVKQRSRVSPPLEVDISSLPTIGVLDIGVPGNHAILSKYRRGAYVAPTSTAVPVGSHGSFVSSRVVFGDPDYSAGLPSRQPSGTARYYDVNVSGIRPGDIEDKSVFPALQAMVATAPDVRVFNMSFDALVPLDSMGPVKRSLVGPARSCRAGPGLCESPKPDFSANGGNGTPQYGYAPGLGVWGVTSTGVWEDRSGTSFAAPLLARESAFALQRLQLVCEREAQPFAVTVKAFLALTAVPPIDEQAVRELAERTLGRGRASARRLDAPSAGTGVMIWQGVLEDEKDIARVQLPIPSDWLGEADEPTLRLIVAWDPPVNAAVKHLWSTRNISAKLRTHPDVPALRTAKLKSHGSYPLLERTFKLNKLPKNLSIEGDSWLIEISYEQIAEYHAAMTFPPQQRVAFAAELLDTGAKKLSPQSHLQALAVTNTMIRLTVPPTAARLPVILRTPV
jgi:hypothetical protein